MSPEERVGQLFLVTFRGTNTGSDSQIYDLIVNHHAGGVVLLAENDNILDQPDTVAAARDLTVALQTIASDSSQNSFEPLFVGISQDGNGAPHDQLLSGLTSLPSQMAIGATWDPSQAHEVGNVLGGELSGLGFNLIFDPSLDVVEDPHSSASSDLGATVFGGDPYWVGEMGRSFIAGLHEGSSDRLMVVAKHFPGRGSSDRLPEQEIATVRKSLEGLKQIELSPFFAVTSGAEPADRVDGLLVSHIRYQGFQGNIRATTRPVSFDSTALSAILALPEFEKWRANSGLIVSDALGSKAVRDFYSQGGQNFSLRSVARDAFQAGNDLLYLGNITSDSDEDITYSATVDILDFFTQEYRNDAAFAQRVDAAVTRILERKFRMYDQFTLAHVLPSTSDLDAIGNWEQIMFDVASTAATLINPDPQELSALLPAPPNQGDRLVFLTDPSTYQQCSTCAVRDAMAVDSLQKAVDRLYGQNGSGQVFSTRMSSFPLSELEKMLNAESETNIESALDRGTWIVISLADVADGQLEILRRFFAERPNLIRNKNVILFSFTAPYYLDATDISNVTAYYCLYSKQGSFVDVAARILFQQNPLQGAPPVSVPAVGYDLIVVTSPDESQVIPLSLDAPVLTGTPASENLTAVPTAIPLYKIGDTIAVRAGPILDANGHLVPDATIARFTMSTRDESGGILRQVDVPTFNGMAGTSFLIDKPGNVEINVISEPALISETLQFDASDEGVAVTVVAPVMSSTPQIVSPTPTLTPVNDLVTPEGYPRIGAWMLVLLALAGGSALMFWGINKLISTRWALRFALSSIVGGLISYNYLALGFPGAAGWIASGGGALGILMLTFVGEVLGSLAAWIWMRSFSARG